MKKKMELVGEGLTIVSVVVSLGFCFLHTWPWLIGCILTLLAALVLALMFPAYFTLLDVKKENASGPQYGISLVLVLCANAIAMVTGQWYAIPQWWQPWLWAAAITVVVVALLAKFSGDFQTGASAAMALACTLVLSYFLVCHVNGLLDFSQPEQKMVTVAELDSSSRPRGLREYICYVEIDGEQLRIEVPRKVYSEIEVGDEVFLETHDGALGIEFMDLHIMQ